MIILDLFKKGRDAYFKRRGIIAIQKKTTNFLTETDHLRARQQKVLARSFDYWVFQYGKWNHGLDLNAKLTRGQKENSKAAYNRLVVPYNTALNAAKRTDSHLKAFKRDTKHTYRRTKKNASLADANKDFNKVLRMFSTYIEFSMRMKEIVEVMINMESALPDFSSYLIDQFEDFKSAEVVDIDTLNDLLETDPFLPVQRGLTLGVELKIGS